MKSINEYVNEVKTLALEHNQHFKEITADGVIDYGESLETQELLREYHDNLHRLKRHASTDMRELQYNYSEQMLVTQQSYEGDERRQEMQRLHNTRHQLEDAYQKIIERVNFLLVGIPQTQQMIEDHIDALEAQMGTLFDKDTAETYSPVQTMQFNALSLTTGIQHELNSAAQKWQSILDNIEARSTASAAQQTPQQKAYEIGVAEALRLALADVQDIITLMESEAIQ